MDWPWTAPEQGRYVEKWTDNYDQHYYKARWTSGLYRIEIVLRRLAPAHYWTPSVEIDEKWLNWWSYLRKMGASEMTTISCAANHCVTFKAEGRECVGFKYVAGTLGSREEGDQGSDLVEGFYCPAATENGADKLDEILKTIVIKK